MCRRGSPARASVARLLAVALVCSLVVASAAAPVAAQADGESGDDGRSDADGRSGDEGGPSDDSATAGGASGADERRCFPPGGRDLTVGDGDPHIDVTVHTSLFTSPAPPSALGLSARGVALGADIVELRTGVLFQGTPEEASESALWDSFAILFDYRLSLPMFADAHDDSTYEPDGGPVSGVETRRC